LTRARFHSANSQSASGNGLRASRSIFSNNSRRLTPSLRIGRSFMRWMASAMAALHSASEKNVCRRNRPRI
jgi:hypothetical protein